MSSRGSVRDRLERRDYLGRARGASLRQPMPSENEDDEERAQRDERSRAGDSHERHQAIVAPHQLRMVHAFVKDACRSQPQGSDP